MVGGRSAGVILLTLVVGTSGAAELPCRATARVVPSEAFVGQQLLYILHIEQRRDVERVRFQPPLSFPSMRSEWLPTVRLPDPSEATRAIQERRAIHPGHAGELRIPEAGLLCETPTASHLVRIPPVGLHVRPVPEAGRPANWNGLVGPLTLQWNLLPDRVTLGESARLSVRIEGPGTVWRVDPAVESKLAPRDADVFVLEPDEERDKGRSLSVRAYRRYDVVPRRTGEVIIPGLRVASFDPTRGRFEEHVLPDLTLLVLPAAHPTGRPGAAGETQPAAEEPSLPPAGASPRPGSRSVAGALAFTALLVAGISMLWRRVVRRAKPAEMPARRLAEATACLDRGEATLAARALAECLAISIRKLGDVGDPFAADAGIGASTSREFTLLAERLERARFSGPADHRELRAIATELGALLVTDRTTDC